MPYDQPSKTQLLAAGEWLDTSELLLFVYSCRLSRFFIKSVRADLLQCVSVISRDRGPLFSSTTRFPGSVYYAQLSGTPLGLWWSCLLETLTCDEKEDAKKKEQQFSTALLKLSSLLDLNSRPERLISNGIFTRSTFEDYYGLVWTETSV